MMVSREARWSDEAIEVLGRGCACGCVLVCVTAAVAAEERI